MNTTDSRVIEPTTAKQAYVAAFAPVEPGSDKHKHLVDWLRKEAETTPTYSGMAEYAESQTDAALLGHMYGQTFAVAAAFPDADGPSWATKHEEPGVDRDSNPTRLWYHEIATDKSFSASVNRDDIYDVDLDKIIEGQPTLSVGIDRNDAIEFLNPEHVREAGRKLMAAADSFEAIVIEGSGHRAFDIERVHWVTRPDAGYLIETTTERNGQPYVTLDVVDGDYTVGEEWSSDPAEFIYRCLARVKFLSEIIGGTRWVEVA